MAAGLFLAGCVLLSLAYREYRPFKEERIRQEAVRTTVVQESYDPMERQIDFAALKKINEEIVGWLYIPQIGVDCPIVKGSTDTEYLTKDFEGNESPLGSVFTYADTDERLSEQHLCLFGHNMPSGQMFGRLAEFEREQFCRENSRYWIYTPGRTKEFEVKEVGKVEKDDAVFQDNWQWGQSDSQTVTLATCAGYGNTSERIAVTGVLRNEKVII